MSILMELLGAAPPLKMRAGDPNDERYWSSVSTSTAAGISISPETALKISTVWACVGLLSEVVAMLPKFVFQYLPNGDRQKALNHPLYDLVHTAPNAQQTAFEFFEMMTGHAMLRGNAYARIVPGPRGPADQLIPLHPDRVTTQILPGNRVRYRVQATDGTTEVLNDEDVLHVRGRSLDGVNGLSVINYARESFGLNLGAEAYGARFFGNDSRPGGVLRTDRKLSEEAAKRLKTSWESAHAAGNQHRVAVLEEGLEWQATGLPPKDAQMLELREFQAEDVCRWFRVPPHMVGLTSKATSWGSGIEQMSIGFVVYTLLPWITRWTQAISRDLIIAPQTYFVDFAVEGLLRGDIQSRYSAYATGRNWGWLSRNDVRKLENMNQIPDGDDYLTPTNMTELGQTPDGPADPSADPVPPDGAPAGTHYQELLRATAGRIARKERKALDAGAKRGADWAEAVSELYADHGQYVAQALAVPVAWAEIYAANRARDLLHTGAKALVPEFEELAVGELMELAELSGNKQ